ncbi:MAG: hypothetical protein RIQ33_1299 [Bacteroidota bacterium]|jgi:hypothetical protein
MKIYLTLLVFILLIAFCNSSKAQVHKLTYREAYNFNVGDEIYYSYFSTSYDLWYSSGSHSYYDVKDKVVSKRFNSLQDTIFYTLQLSSSSITYSSMAPSVSSFNPSTLYSFFITHLDDTIITLNGKDSTTDHIRIGKHYIDSTFCNLKISKLSESHFEGGYDSICIDGVGCYATSSYDGGAHINSTFKLEGYFKGNDSCGKRLLSIDNTLNFYYNCIKAKDFFDSELGDEYLIEKKANQSTLNYRYKKLIGKEYSNSNKSLKLIYEVKQNYPTSNPNCSECYTKDQETFYIPDLDDCYYFHDKSTFNYNLSEFYENSNLLEPCSIPTNTFKFDYPFQSVNYRKHQYIKGYGYLNEINGDKYVQTSNGYQIVKADTTETLLYIKNKFYNCGEMPDFFIRVFKNETENYVNIVPNPVQFGEDVIGYKSASSNISSISFTDELGRFLPTVLKPTCTEKEVTFTIPHQYFHIGLNIVSFIFYDGHQEIHKIIVY